MNASSGDNQAFCWASYKSSKAAVFSLSLSLSLYLTLSLSLLSPLSPSLLPPFPYVVVTLSLPASMSNIMLFNICFTYTKVSKRSSKIFSRWPFSEFATQTHDCCVISSWKIKVHFTYYCTTQPWVFLSSLILSLVYFSSRHICSALLNFFLLSFRKLSNFFGLVRLC